MKLRNPILPLSQAAATLALALGLFGISSSWRGHTHNSGRGPAQHRSGEILVKFSETSFSSGDHMAIIKSHRASNYRKLSPRGLMHIQLPPGQTVADAIKEYSQHSDVESAQPNFLYRKNSGPNDTQFGNLWALSNTGQKVNGSNLYSGGNNPGTVGSDINILPAWNYITDCSSIIVAIVDTGINYTQEDLTANLWTTPTYPKHGANFVGGLTPSDAAYYDPKDLDGHGTHVAGIIGASGNNATGVTGVCWKSKIMALRALDATGSGTTTDIIAAIEFAKNNGAKVINMSFGENTTDPALNNEIGSAVGAGLVIVAAAGNDYGVDNDGTPTYPCNYSTQYPNNVVCVAALDQSFQLATFSNKGATSVTVGAPGTNIISSWAGTSSVVNDFFYTSSNNVKSLSWTNSGSNSGTAISPANPYWGYSQQTLSTGPTNMITAPANWDLQKNTYANNLDARIFNTFNLAGDDAVILDFGVFYDTEPNRDYFNVEFSPQGGDPFIGKSNTDQYSGLSGTNAFHATRQTYDISSCNTAQCTIGFQLTSDATNPSGSLYFGVGIYGFNLQTLKLNPNTYVIENGTSMATPFVTGLIAMVMAFQGSNYTGADAVQAVKNGGLPTPSLSGVTSTGNAINAMKAISYINAPASVSATLQ